MLHHPLVAAFWLVAGVLVAAGGAIDSFNGTLIAIGLLTTAFTGAYTAYATHHTKKITAVIAKGIDTLNDKQPGQLLAETETRRIEEIPHDERTASEQHHLDTAPLPDPPQGPSR